MDWIARWAGVLVLGLLGVGGSFANTEPLVEAETVETEIVLIPAGTLPAGLVGEVRKYIEARHRLKASVFPEMPMDPAWVIPGMGRQNAERMAISSSATTAGTRVKKPFTIVITGSDINDPEMGLRYLFFLCTGDAMTISTKRMNYGSRSGPLGRILKCVNWGIGRNVYGLETSRDMGSVMYGPIMGPKDLDNMGEWCK